MRKLVFMAIALCGAVLGCRREDTEGADKWRRVEPRLTGVTEWRSCTKRREQGRATDSVQCEGATLPTSTVCRTEITSHTEAIDAIAREQQCIDSAIAFLRDHQRESPEMASDLAAAYYVRAQLRDNPVDLMDAWETAQDVANLPAARFNLGLIQEALGLPEQAMKVFNAYRASDSSAWGQEADQHFRRLSAVPRLAPTAYQDFEQALQKWAQSGQPSDLDKAQSAATKIAEIHKDSYALDVLNAGSRSLTDFRRAYKLYQDGYNQYSKEELEEAASSEREATRMLQARGNPMELETERIFQLVDRRMHYATYDTKQADVLLALKRRATKYPYMRAQIASSRGYVLDDAERRLESLLEYEEAIQGFAALGDVENQSGAHIGKSGVYLQLGQKEKAWREVCLTNSYAGMLVAFRLRHVRLTTLADTAQKLGHPRLAILYPNDADLSIRHDLQALSPAEDSRRAQSLHYLGVVLRKRAEIEIDLGQLLQAGRDLEEAKDLAAKERKDKEGVAPEDLLIRIDEVNGRSQLADDPKAAAASFSAALDKLPVSGSALLRSSLLASRAEAYAAIGDQKQAEIDLRHAIDVLRTEENIQLSGRRRGDTEEVWSGGYFARSRSSYQRLIAALVTKGRPWEAFVYAERSKALDPLNLVRGLAFAPHRFLQRTEGNRPIELEALQKELPEDTVLVEYTVLQDKTFAWIVSRNWTDFAELPVGREAVSAWRMSIQDAVNAGWRLTPHLAAPREGLVGPVLSRIQRHTTARRLVIIPDGDMHGLPFAAMYDALQRRFLIEDWIVSVHGSATLYVFALMRDAELRAASSALLVGHPTADPGLTRFYGLDDLPASEEEVEKIKKYYAPDYRLLTGPDATTPAFLNAIGSSEIVHVANHAVVNEEAPWDSFLLFAPAAGDSGQLGVKTLARLKLPRTRIVVLASCSSGGGAAVGAEGVAPLVRPFIGAGVPGMVGTLWNIEDATATDLLVSFHQHYRDLDAAAALRQAQLDALRKDPAKQAVKTWAAYEVVGFASASRTAHATNTKEKSP